jgi:hypothetical protein
MYNIFNNVISNTATIHNNIRGMVSEALVPIQKKLNYLFSNECYIDVGIAGIEGRYMRSNYQITILNNYFIDI